MVGYDEFQSSGSIVSLDEPRVGVLGRWHWRVAGEVLQPVVGNGHAADEWLALVPTAKVIGGLVLEWCEIAE